MCWGSGEAGVEERMGQAVIESFKALSLLPWFGTDFLLTLIQALAVHMLLIWIFFFFILHWKVWSVPSPWLTSQDAKVLWCKYFRVLQSECYHDGAQVKERGGRAGVQHGCIQLQTLPWMDPAGCVCSVESGQFCGAEFPKPTQGCAQAWDPEQRELHISPVLSPAPNWQQIVYLTAFISV